MTDAGDLDVTGDYDAVIGGVIIVSTGTLLSAGLNELVRAVLSRGYSPTELRSDDLPDSSNQNRTTKTGSPKTVRESSAWTTTHRIGFIRLSDD